MELGEPRFFDHSDKDMKRLIKYQGDRVCRQRIYNSVLLDSLSCFRAGYAFVLPKARIGQSTRRVEDRVVLYGFVLLQVVGGYDLHVNLICVDESYRGAGNILMDKVFEYAVEHELTRVTLHSLPDERLVLWYKSLGFLISESLYKDGELKVHYMTRSV